jgi:hypothetical protein
MIDPKQNPSPDEEETARRKPELEPETLKDLTPTEGKGEEVKGGATLGQTAQQGGYETETM